MGIWWLPVVVLICWIGFFWWLVKTPSNGTSGVMGYFILGNIGFIACFLATVGVAIVSTP